MAERMTRQQRLVLAVAILGSFVAFLDSAACRCCASG